MQRVDSKNIKDFKNGTFYVLLILGLFIRIIYSTVSFHAGDLSAWQSLGEFIYVWHISPFIWWSQGPFDAIPLMGFQWINYLGFSNSYLLSISYHIPFIVGDLLVLLAVYICAREFFAEKKHLVTLVIWFDSMLIFISSIWGQSDSWMVAFTLFSFYFFSKRKIWWGAIALGAAAAVKYIPFVIMPALLPFHHKIRDLFTMAVGVILPILFGFSTIFLINVVMYHDLNFIHYFLDRSGTIFGNFIPNLGGGGFISTGTSLWGELFQLNILSAGVLTPNQEPRGRASGYELVDAWARGV